jgi:hypothetical protein
VRGALVVIYNAQFDAGFLGDLLRGAAEVRCAMLAFAEAFGAWSDWHDGWRWQKLSAAAAHVGHVWTGAAHRALADCAARHGSARCPPPGWTVSACASRLGCPMRTATRFAPR